MNRNEYNRGDVPIYGGYDRRENTDIISNIDSDFFNPSFESINDVREWCNKYSEFCPNLLYILNLIDSPETKNFINYNLSIPVAVIGYEGSFETVHNYTLNCMDIENVGGTIIKELQEYNKIDESYDKLEGTFFDLSFPLPENTNPVVKGIPILPLVLNPVLSSGGLAFSARSPAYNPKHTKFLLTYFSLKNTKEGGGIPVKLTKTLLNLFSTKGDELTFKEYMDKYIER